MRERLVATLVGMTITMLALYGIPRAYMLADLVTGFETRSVTRAAENLSVVIEERNKTGEPVTADYLRRFLRDGDTLSYEPAEGSVVLAGPARDESEDILRTRDLPDGSTLTLSRSRDQIDQEISDALTPLILIGLSLTFVAAAFGFVLARRLSRPFKELASEAERLGLGHFDVDPPHYAIPEAEAIAEALRSSSDRLGELVRREREFASNASHQLRTPITALRLELEDLSLWPQTPPEVADELNRYLPELDRLSSAIDELLGLARGHRLGDAIEVNLCELADDVVERWRPMAQDAGHEIDHAAHGAVMARIVPGPVLQILDVLVENAMSHGTGRIVIEAQDLGAYVRIVVRDEGRRTFGNEIFQRGTSQKTDGRGGLGLTIAADLATTMGGYLKLTDDDRTTFELLLPGRGEA